MGKVVVVSAEVTGGSGGGVAARWWWYGKGDEVEWLVGMTIMERVAWWCASVGGDGEGGVERWLRRCVGGGLVAAVRMKVMGCGWKIGMVA
ncbi:hypothetical protein Tco_0166272 [Tanacetum coccineum]